MCCFCLAQSLTDRCTLIRPGTGHVRKDRAALGRVLLSDLDIERIGVGYWLHIVLLSGMRFAECVSLQTGVHRSVCLLQVVILVLQNLDLRQ